MNKMISCKSCGAEIAASAKSCPKCGAKNKKPIWKRVWVWILAAIIVIAVAGSMGSEPEKIGEIDATPTSTTNEEVKIDIPPIETSTNPTANEEVEEKHSFTVGEIVELYNVSAALIDVYEVNDPDTLFPPTDGHTYLMCEFEITNNSTEDIVISSALSFEGYCDDYVCPFNLYALMAKGEKNQLDGTVAAGKKFRGVIGYEVPTDWKEMEIHFAPDVWVGKDIVFIATNG